MQGFDIPLVDLVAQHREVSGEIWSGFAEVMEKTSFVLDRHVTEFEEAFARYCDVTNCVGVANGTDAIELCLRAVGVGSDDEVVIPTNSYVATAEAVARTGAVPVLVDCDPHFQLIDPDQVAARTGSQTAAIVPVHLFGQIAPLDELQEACRTSGAVIIEDAAQCQGARRLGRPPAHEGTAAATSFYPGKNLGAYGDAGAVITSDDALARKLRLLRNHGGVARYEHIELGFNSRMDALQAVVLLAKLSRLDEWNEMRRAAARRYEELLTDLDAVRLPDTLPGNEHVWHLYVVRVPDRDQVLERLHKEGIGADIHYPVPIHLLPAFASLGHKRGDFPVAEQAAQEIVSLPIYPGITASQQERVAEVLRGAVRRS